MNITYYKAIRNDDTVASAGDIIRVDWDRDSDGTPAYNMTTGKTYCPFRADNADGVIMEKITAESAVNATDNQYIKLIKRIMLDENTNLLQASGIAMRKIGDAADAVRAEFDATGRIQA